MYTEIILKLIRPHVFGKALFLESRKAIIINGLLFNRRKNKFTDKNAWLVTLNVIYWKFRCDVRSGSDSN